MKARMLIADAVVVKASVVEAVNPAEPPWNHVHPVPRVAAAPPVESCFRTTT